MMQHLRINGAEHGFHEGESILDVSERVGVRIPTLCHVEGLLPEAGCRLCLVESSGDERPVGA